MNTYSLMLQVHVSLNANDKTSAEVKALSHFQEGKYLASEFRCDAADLIAISEATAMIPPPELERPRPLSDVMEAIELDFVELKHRIGNDFFTLTPDQRQRATVYIERSLQIIREQFTVIRQEVIREPAA